MISRIARILGMPRLPETQRIPMDQRTRKILMILRIPMIPMMQRIRKIPRTQKTQRIHGVPRTQKIHRMLRIPSIPMVPKVHGDSGGSEDCEVEEDVRILRFLTNRRNPRSEDSKDVDDRQSLGAFEDSKD